MNNTTVELAPEGYEKLNAGLERLEQAASNGIANPEKALECCRQIRVELYGILQTLRDVCVIKPAENGGNYGAA
ncbi:MAG: hypothetical protein FWG29_07805 [Treponema sp.]|nr:hypothetical protein [Treponema sp.]